MRGPELAKRLKTVLPHLKIVYMTGTSKQTAPTTISSRTAFFLQKPFSRETVVGRSANP